MKTIITYSAFVATFLVFETSILSNIYFLPVIPDFLLLFTIYVSIQKGGVHGESVGFFSGLFLDFFSICPLGLNSLLRTIIGFIFGLFHLNIGTSGIFVPMGIGLVATIIKILLTGLISIFFPGVIYSYSLFSSIFWVECLLNTLLAPILFFIFSKFKTISSVQVYSVNDI